MIGSCSQEFMSSLSLPILLCGEGLFKKWQTEISVVKCEIYYPWWKKYPQFICSVMSDSLQPHGLQHPRLPYPSPTPGGCSNSFLLSQWCYLTISSSVIPFSSCLQSFPASGSFLVIQFFTSSGQCIGVSASTSVLPRDQSGWISLQSKGLSRVFSNTTVQKHQFFSAQPSL